MILSLKEIQEKIRKLQGWNLESNSITKTFEFKDFKLALYFVNKVGELAEKHGHHPLIVFDYNAVKLSLTTHSEKGLTEKDFVLAEEIDKIE